MLLNYLQRLECKLSREKNLDLDRQIQIKELILTPLPNGSFVRRSSASLHRKIKVTRFREISKSWENSALVTFRIFLGPMQSAQIEANCQEGRTPFLPIIHAPSPGHVRKVMWISTINPTHHYPSFHCPGMVSRSIHTK